MGFGVAFSITVFLCAISVVFLDRASENVSLQESPKPTQDPLHIDHGSNFLLEGMMKELERKENKTDLDSVLINNRVNDRLLENAQKLNKELRQLRKNHKTNEEIRD